MLLSVGYPWRVERLINFFAFGSSLAANGAVIVVLLFSSLRNLIDANIARVSWKKATTCDGTCTLCLFKARAHIGLVEIFVEEVLSCSSHHF